MLKKGIKNWGLYKDHKRADMVLALRFALQREAQGKKTVFLIRSRVVTFHNIKQYFWRKGVHNLHSLVTDSDIVPPTMRVYWRTPEPDVMPDGSTHGPEFRATFEELTLHDFDASISSVGPGIVALRRPEPLGRVMPLTTTLENFDRLLYHGRNYNTHVFENHNWRTENESFELRSLEMCYHNMFDGQYLLERSQVNEAFEHIYRAFDQIHHLLKQNIFLLLPYITICCCQLGKSANTK
jgi:hypothetical protein